MGKAIGEAEPPPWRSHAAAATGSPEQRRRGLLDAPLRERAPCRRRPLLARSSWWCGVAISVAVGLLAPPAARPWWWWWCAVAISLAAGLLAPPAARPSWWWWCGVAISLAAGLLAPPAARPSCWCWCGVVISLATGLLTPPAARPSWWSGVSASSLTISARWSADQLEPMPMASPDSRNDLAEIPSEETSQHGLDGPFRERAPCRRRDLLARSSWWCGVTISVAVGLLVPPVARPWWWWWCGVAISLAAGLLVSPAVRLWWWCGVVVSLTISARWSMDKGKPMPMVSPDSRNDLAEIQGEETSQQGVDDCRSTSQDVTVFIRHCSGLVVLTVNLDQSSEHMMNLYEQKTKTKIANEYFKYGLKRIEPEYTLRSYGIARNNTIDLCGRLLGGRTDTLENYVSDNAENFSVEVTLPDGSVSLDMTKLGCLILLTLLKCFTHTFAHFKSWNGDITMNDFKVTDGHVRVIKHAEENLNGSSLQADLKVLIFFIRRMFYKGNSKSASKYPPYLNSLIRFLLALRAPFLSDDDILFIETHMSCLESFARGMLLIKLRKKYKSLPPSKKKIWNAAIKGLDKLRVPYTNVYQVSEMIVFRDIIQYAKNENKAYSGTRRSTLRLMRDEFTHGPSHRFDKSVKPWEEKFKNDNGIELMVPANFDDTLPSAIHSLIKAEGIDIKKELLAAQVRCICPSCHPCYLELNKLPSKKHKTKDGGESSEHGGETWKHGEEPSKGVAQTALPRQKATNSLGLSKTSQEVTCSSEGSQVKNLSLIKNATAKASPQKMQPSTPSPSQVKPKLPSTDDDGFTKKKGKKKKGKKECPTVRGGYSVSMLWFSITISLLLFCVIVAAVFLL